jgi:hypothetical protein
MSDYALKSIGAQRFILFSCDLRSDGLADGNAKRSNFESFMAGRGVPYRRVQGRYKGLTETSYISGAEHFHSVRYAPQMHGQESILVLGEQRRSDRPRPAMLHYLDGRLPEPLGYFCPVSGDYIRKEKPDGYTYDLRDDQFYVCLTDPADAY